MVNVGTITAILLLLSIFYALSTYWVIVFSYRIYQSKKCLRVAARHLLTVQSDDSGTNFEQFCYHYQTEIKKYAYLLLINLNETFCIVLFPVTAFVDINYITFPDIENEVLLKLSNCSKVENPNLDKFYYHQAANPILNTLSTLQNILELFLLIFSINLMKYLTQRIKNTRYPSKSPKFRLFLISTALLSVFIIGLTWREYFASLLMITVLLIYFYLFLRAVKQFEYSLLQSAIEILIQFGPNKSGFRQYKHFKYTMRTVCCGYSIIMVAKLLGYLPGFLTSILFYRNCQFLLRFIPDYDPILWKPDQIAVLIRVLTYIWRLAHIFAVCGIIIIISPFTGITLYIWFSKAYKSIRGTSKKIYRYNRDNIQDPLLVQC